MNEFATFNQENAQYCSLDIYIILSHQVFLRVPINKGSSSGNRTKAIPHETKLDTFVHTWHLVKVKCLKYGQFFVEELCKCPGFQYTVLSLPLIYFISRSNTLIQLFYKELSTFWLSDSFTPCPLCIKVANLVSCGIALVWFRDDDLLWIEICRNVHCDIII
jgi:hypothetical protein